MVTVDTCLEQISKLSQNEREELFRHLESQMKQERHLQFHVSFDREIIQRGRIKTAVSDLSVLSIED